MALAIVRARSRNASFAHGSTELNSSQNSDKKPLQRRNCNADAPDEEICVCMCLKRSTRGLSGNLIRARTQVSKTPAEPIYYFFQIVFAKITRARLNKTDLKRKRKRPQSRPRHVLGVFRQRELSIQRPYTAQVYLKLQGLCDEAL